MVSKYYSIAVTSSSCILQTLRGSMPALLKQNMDQLRHKLFPSVFMLESCAPTTPSFFPPSSFPKQTLPRYASLPAYRNVLGWWIYCIHTSHGSLAPIRNLFPPLLFLNHTTPCAWGPVTDKCLGPSLVFRCRPYCTHKVPSHVIFSKHFFPAVGHCYVSGCKTAALD